MRPVVACSTSVSERKAGQPGRARRRVRPRPAHHLPAPLHRPHPPGRRVRPRRWATRRRCWPRCSSAAAAAGPRRAGAVVDVVVRDDTGRLTVVFFNQPWRAKQLAAGTEALFFGKVGEYRGTRQMVNPVVDVRGRRGRRGPAATLRILPVYPASAKAGLTSWEIGAFVAEALERAGEFADPLPAEWRSSLDLWDRTDGLRRHPPARVARRGRRRPAAGWPSTSSSACSWPWCCAAGPSRSTPGPCTTTCRRARSPAPSTRHPGGPLPGRPALRAHHGPAPGPGGHRGRPGRARSPCTGCSRATSARARRWWRWPRCWPRSRAATRARSMVPTEVLAEQHFAAVRALLGRPRGPRRHGRRRGAGASCSPAGSRARRAPPCSTGWPRAPSTSWSAPTPC